MELALTFLSKYFYVNVYLHIASMMEYTDVNLAKVSFSTIIDN